MGIIVFGQELCGKFHVSRTAVWKVINQLKEEGMGSRRCRIKRYRLNVNPDVLSFSELKSRMRTKWAGRNIVYW